MGFVPELGVVRCCRLVNECMVLAVLGLRADHAQCPVDSYVLAFWIYFGAEWDLGNIGYIEFLVYSQFIEDADAVSRYVGCKVYLQHEPPDRSIISSTGG